MKQKRAGCLTIRVVAAFLLHSFALAFTVAAQSTMVHLNAEQRQQIKDIRQRALETIEAIIGMLNAPSFAARAVAYCRFYVDQSPSMIPGIRTEKQAEKRYAELMRSEPPTRDEEMRRQHQLRVLRDRMAAFAQNVSECQGMVTAGAQTIPSPDELRKQLAEERRAVSRADEVLANR